MAKAPDIIVSTYVRRAGELVDTRELDPEERRKFSTWLKLTYLNRLFEGKAKFHVAANADTQQHRG